jgi:Xaa-Pro aminopeptidase
LEDGVAVTKFLAWLFDNPNKIDEINAALALVALRQERKLFQFPSFATISAYGANASIIHYQPTRETNRTIGSDNLYLIDSGGQYLNGTTDITRTICLDDKHKKIHKKYFTLVLKGQIALATTKFPKGTTGTQLDALARYFLWQKGKDYAHGTGHGVGHFLSVHEGPQRISTQKNSVALEPGMIISNEPGYYKNNKFGIRIENLLLVKASKLPNFFEFETLTLAPIQTSLVDFTMLTNQEKKWLSSYNKHVTRSLEPYLTEKEKAFINNHTKK